MNILSNDAVATEAISGIKAVSVNKGEQVSLGQSTVASMKKGAEVTNQLVSDLSQLVECVQEQSHEFPKIAEMFTIIDSKIK